MIKVGDIIEVIDLPIWIGKYHDENCGLKGKVLQISDEMVYFYYLHNKKLEKYHIDHLKKAEEDLIEITDLFSELARMI